MANENHSVCSTLKKIVKYALPALLLFALLLLAARWVGDVYSRWDDDEQRGALAVAQQDKFGDHFEKTVYLKQNWTEKDSLWFYTATQGSDIMPYDFFLALEQKDNAKLFRDNENINHYRYLPQKKTFSNPDALPVGMVKDTYKRKAYMGFTCAACHTSQINYNGTGIRIDGGPSGADMQTFLEDMAAALNATLKGEDKAKLDRFVNAVLKKGEYDDRASVLADLEKYSQRISTYNIINRPVSSEAGHPNTPYGYARLDAFGRIFNRVLEHIMSASQLREILQTRLPADEVDKVMKDAEPILSGDDRDHIIERLSKAMGIKRFLELRNAIYNPADAPVSYPFLWDIPQHDYVQWNGIVANAGVGPIGRNAGQVIGVFGTLDWKEQKKGNLSTLLGGQGYFGPGPFVNFESSLDIRNLRLVEHALSKLQSPQWPEEILGKIDQQKAKRGAPIFARYCASCHAEIDRSSATRRVVAQMSHVDAVGTDDKMAKNSVTATGYSGILKNLYVDTGVGKLLMEEKAPIASLLTAATRNVITTPDPDKWRIIGWLERIYDFATTLGSNEVQASLKRGSYEPDTTVNPFASLYAYKARSLNGIWATAPYLHNGSVPTLYDLLLPAEERPLEFKVGSREFDPVKVGFKHEDYDGFRYRTVVRGNHNTGHEYAAGRTAQPDGTVLPALGPDERDDLLEYLKTL